MVNIGELLGRGEIANLFSEAVEEGEVYRLRLSINSEINPYLPACRKELHYLLKATDYDFLGRRGPVCRLFRFQENFQRALCRFVLC